MNLFCELISEHRSQNSSRTKKRILSKQNLSGSSSCPHPGRYEWHYKNGTVDRTRHRIPLTPLQIPGSRIPKPGRNSPLPRKIWTSFAAKRWDAKDFRRACLVRGEADEDHDGGEGEEPEDELHRHGCRTGRLIVASSSGAIDPRKLPPRPLFFPRAFWRRGP